jgi:hypothetical protein
MLALFSSENLKGRGCFEYLVVDGMAIIKWSLKT